MCLSNISDTAPNAPIKTGTTVTSFGFHNFLISSLRSWYFSIFLLLLLFNAGKLLALWERVVAYICNFYLRGISFLMSPALHQDDGQKMACYVKKTTGGGRVRKT